MAELTECTRNIKSETTHVQPLYKAVRYLRFPHDFVVDLLRLTTTAGNCPADSTPVAPSVALNMFSSPERVAL